MRCFLSVSLDLTTFPVLSSADVVSSAIETILQLIDCSALHSISITEISSLLWLRLTSHSSLLLGLFQTPMRPPRLRCVLFPLIYSPHLLAVLLATLGLHLHLQIYPYSQALYVISVRRTESLLTASFRFHLAMDTLAVQLCASSLPRCARDFHPLESAHGGQTNKSLQSLATLIKFFGCGGMTSYLYLSKK